MFYVLSENNLIRISCGSAHVHSMSSLTTKLHEILINGFKRVAKTNYFSSLMQKRGIIFRKIIESEIPGNMHIFMVCPY